MDDGEKVLYNITRIYTDTCGNSRFGSFTVSLTGSGDIGYLSELIQGSGVLFRHTSADYCYAWHTAPRRQFIVNLDADVEIEVSSGEKRVISKGEVFFVEDTTGKGHYSRAVGNKPRNSLFIPVSDDYLTE